MPADGYKVPFLRLEYFPANSSIYAAIVFFGKAWVACPVGDTSVYQVSAQYIGWKSNCIPFEMQAVDYIPLYGMNSTWQYS